MHGHGKIVFSRVLERGGVERGRVSLLGTCQIKRNYAVILELYRESGHLERLSARVVPQRADDEPSGDTEVLLGSAQAPKRRLDCLNQRQSLYHIEDRGVSHLDVAHAIAPRIL